MLACMQYMMIMMLKSGLSEAILFFLLLLMMMPIHGQVMLEACPADSFSLQDWGQCCSYQQASLCKGQSMNRNCTCAPMVCQFPDEEPQRAQPGQIVCIKRPHDCSHMPCEDGSMIREMHTCNCFRLNRQSVLWGNAGGPYFEIA